MLDTSAVLIAATNIISMIRITVVSMVAVMLSACYVEGGGCSGPFCFAVATDVCDGGIFDADQHSSCQDQQVQRCPDADDIQAIALQEINRIRSTVTQCGSVPYPVTDPVIWSDAFFVAADRHALDMAGNNFVAPIGSDGLGVTDRVSVEVTYITHAVAGGYSDTRTLIREWNGIAEDCAAMADSRVSELALACRYDSDSNFGQYWTLVAGSR
ncbi:MAG: hypothetical protein AAF404_02105 [Pseudomonadota bacterium]